MIGELTNHVWQSTLFSVAAGLLTVAFRTNRAQIRYWLWLSASLKFLIPFSLLMSLGNRVEWATTVRKIATQGVSSTVVQITQPFTDTLSFSPPTTSTINWLPIALLCVWACGFGVIALIRLQGWFRIRAAVRSSVPLKLCSTAIEIRSSSGLLEPGVVGLLRPILLLPTGIVERLTPRQFEAVLAHELCHVRRRDNLSAAIHMIVEGLFWFHPLVWWIGARLVQERERACDEDVLQLGGEPHVYAEAILNVCKHYLESPLVCVSGITSSDLKKRIHNILAQHIAQNLTLPRKLLLAVGGSAAVIVPIAIGSLNVQVSRAQSTSGQSFGQDSKPSFEVASIKSNNSGGSAIMIGGPDIFHGRFHARNVSVLNLLQYAFNVMDFQISGGPGWIRSQRFDIEAKADAPLTLDRAHLMMQSLLAQRFQLKVRRESKNGPVYALVIAKNGPKLKLSGDQTPPALGAPPSGTPGGPGPQPPAQVGLAKDINGVPRGGARIGAGSLRASARRVDVLVQLLSRQLARPVLDRTGLTGLYDIDLTWTPDQVPADMPPDVRPDPNGPSIFTALTEQLGLKLESATGPVEMLVIEKVEQPSAN